MLSNDQNQPGLLCLLNLQESLQGCLRAVKLHSPPNATILDCSSWVADFHLAQIDQKMVRSSETDIIYL